MSHLSIKHVQTNAKQNRTRCVCTGRDLTTGVEDGKGGLRCVFGLLLLCLFSISTQVLAEKALQFDIPSQQADEALLQFGVQADISVVYQHEVVKHYQTNRLRGVYTPTQAVRILLQDSGLQAKFKSRAHLVVTQTDRERDSMKTKKKLLALLVGVFATGGGDALAQGQGQSEEEWLLEEIVVTAQKREQRLIDVPMSVAALSGEQMADAGITDLQSLSLAVPGLFVSETSSFFQNISIRGIGNTFGSSNLVGVYLDEASVVGAAGSLIDLHIHDIERIEVLKGPQGTLYGEGSVGGTIRYITKDPDLETFSGQFSVEGSRISSGERSSEVKSVLNVPLTDTLGLRMVGQYTNLGGWIDQPALGKKDINDQEIYNIRAKLLWQPMEALDLKASIVRHRNDAGAEDVGEDDEGNFQQALGIASTPSLKDEYDFYNLNVNYDFGGMQFVSSTAYLESKKEAFNVGGPCCGDPDDPSTLLYIVRSDYLKSDEVFTQEFRLSSSDNEALKWSAGVFVRDISSIPIEIGEALVTTPGVFEVIVNDFVNAENSTSWALFGEASYAFSDQWEVGAGIRYFEDEREFQEFRGGPFESATFDSTNPKLFVSYSVNDDMQIYANAAKGFRSGGHNGSGIAPYEPESVWSYELGAKAHWLEGRLNTEIALFFSDYDDYQVLGIRPGEIFSTISNAGQAEIKGVDLSMTWLAFEQLRLGFNGNYTDTEFVEVNASSSSHVVGDPVDQVPRYGYTFWANYSFTWFDGAPGFARLDYNKQGKAFYRNRSFSNNYVSSSDKTDMVNGRIGWEDEMWELSLYGINLLNERGYINSLAVEEQGVRSRPRTLGLKVDMKF